MRELRPLWGRPPDVDADRLPARWTEGSSRDSSLLFSCGWPRPVRHAEQEVHSVHSKPTLAPPWCCGGGPDQVSTGMCSREHAVLARFPRMPVPRSEPLPEPVGAC